MKEHWREILLVIMSLYIIRDVNADMYEADIQELKQSRQAYMDSAKVHFNNYQTLKGRYNQVVGRFYSKTAKADSIHNLAPIKVNYEGISNDSIMRDLDHLLGND